MEELIYHFRVGHADGSFDMSEILGGKGAGLAQMCKLSLPIPEGFTISSELCQYYQQYHALPDTFHDTLIKAIEHLENVTGKRFADKSNPLLLSIRSGAKVSMPGMMDTILNLGMNDNICDALAHKTNNERFALDSYMRFLEMYASTVYGISNDIFSSIFEECKITAGIYSSQDVTVQILKSVVAEFKNIVLQHTNQPFPDDPYDQLNAAILAVLKSWNSKRAITYRRINNITENYGTAVNVQSMVFGNMGDLCGTGVVFTRCPSTGNNNLFGEFLTNAQGEDIVSGIRTPHPIAQHEHSMQKLMPHEFAELTNICNKLEIHYRDVQDIEFTIEKGKLYILQTRSAKRSIRASIKIAIDMEAEGIISKEDALMSINTSALHQILHANIDYSKGIEAITKGLPASPGAATGIVVFSPYDVEEMCLHHKVILVRSNTCPEDINGIFHSVGLVTATGGMTSHAAVVTRGMGKPCVCGAAGLIIDEHKKTLTIGDTVIKQGDKITIDGSNGNIFLGNIPLTQPDISEQFSIILKWADDIRHLDVRGNAETKEDTISAMKFGAQGIGLARTEHMFFDKNKIPLIQEMIVANDETLKNAVIANLLQLQINDFKELFKVVNGNPINIRLLDPPLHEFLPSKEEDKCQLARRLNISIPAINQRLHALHEVNPMLGHRGCRLGVSHPEIYQMQVEAILTAMKNVQDTFNLDTVVELMIPLISNVRELQHLISDVRNKIIQLEKHFDLRFNITLGSMIELPRAALIAGDLAKEVDYFSFGTNDLTQTTYGISRDDISSFLPFYLQHKILDVDPFITVDQDGVGELMQIAIKRARHTKPRIKIGVCGEHAGDPESIEFFHKIGLDYISCSPYRIPIARIAAAQAKIKHKVY